MPPPQRPAYAEEEHSGLEVAFDRERYAPEIDLRHQPDKEAVPVSDGSTNEYSEKPLEKPDSKRRICGMRRPIAFTVFAIIGLLIVGGVVGGAVGGTMAANSGSDQYGTAAKH
jgi:hypothetical protein